MKFLVQTFSIVVILLFLFTINFKSFITISYFVNQAEIIEIFCINKEKPELKCNGKCHLELQLTEVESITENYPFTLSNVEYSLEISFSLLEDNIIFQPKNNELLEPNYSNHTSSTIDGYNSTLSPPPKG